MWNPPSPTASVLGYASTGKQLKDNITSRGGGGKLALKNDFSKTFLQLIAVYMQ